MGGLLESLTRSVESATWVAVLAALVWGVASVVLSPCHLASIPLIVGYVARQQGEEGSSPYLLSGVFATGILASLAAIGAVTAMLGRVAGDLGGWANHAAAAAFFVFGLHLLGVLSLPGRSFDATGVARPGPIGAFVLGLVFGVGLGPCTFAFMAPVLATTFRAAESAPLLAVGLPLAFGVGHCGAIGFAGGSIGAVQRYLSNRKAARAAVRFRQACGLLVLAGGLYLLYAA